MSGLLDDEKRFYQRFWALNGDPLLLGVFHQFGVEPFRRSCVLEGFADLLAAAHVSGRRCLEIGTWQGLTALVLARHFGEVVSIDIRDDPDPERIRAAMRIGNVRFMTVADNMAKAAAISQLDFDFAFLDGDHAHDTESDFALVERCGAVLLHEYWLAQPPVVELVERLRQGRGGHVMTSGKFALWRAARRD